MLQSVFRVFRVSGLESSSLDRFLGLRKDIFDRSGFWLVGGDGLAYDVGYGGLEP